MGMPDCRARVRASSSTPLPQTGPEGVDPQALRQIVTHGGVDAEDLLGRIGVAVVDRPRSSVRRWGKYHSVPSTLVMG